MTCKRKIYGFSWRSGSTFLGDILNHYPGVFYSFEPLHYLSRLYHTGNESQAFENEIRWTSITFKVPFFAQTKFFI
jgi:hypothetical protein